MCDALTPLAAMSAGAVDDHRVLIAVCVGCIVALAHCACLAYVVHRLLSSQPERHIMMVLGFIAVGIFGFAGWCVVLKVVFANEHAWPVLVGRLVEKNCIVVSKGVLQMCGTCSTIANAAASVLNATMVVFVDIADPAHNQVSRPRIATADVVRLGIGVALVVLCYVAYIVDRVRLATSEDNESDTESEDSVMLVASFVPFRYYFGAEQLHSLVNEESAV